MAVLRLTYLNRSVKLIQKAIKTKTRIRMMYLINQLVNKVFLYIQSLKDTINCLNQYQ